MRVQYDLVVDFARPNKSNTIIISENDRESRFCRFTLLANKQVFDMTDVTTASVKAINHIGRVTVFDADITTDSEGNKFNEVTFTLPAAIAETTGKTTMTITLQGADGSAVTSFEFYVTTRNALYSEDDYIDDEDLNGFRDLLNRTRAALEKMEQMTLKDALPNPYALNVDHEGKMYAYSGNTEVNIDLGFNAYIAQDETKVVNGIDESAAGIATRAANTAIEKADVATKASAVCETAKTTCTTSVAEVVAAELSCNQAKLEAEAQADRAEAIADSINQIDIATTSTNGIAHPDGTTITIDSGGTLSIPDIANIKAAIIALGGTL